MLAELRSYSEPSMAITRNPCQNHWFQTSSLRRYSSAWSCLGLFDPMASYGICHFCPLLTSLILGAVKKCELVCHCPGEKATQALVKKKINPRSAISKGVSRHRPGRTAHAASSYHRDIDFHEAKNIKPFRGSTRTVTFTLRGMFKEGDCISYKKKNEPAQILSLTSISQTS